MPGEVSAPTDVFINCPFDQDYAPQFEALIFGVMACGFRPRSARELDDGGQTRIEKLYGIIEECRYGVHDLSRTELDAMNDLPRFNMPLELGLFLGAKRFGGDAHQTKRALILDVEPYRYQRFISDLSGMDIADHGGDVDRTLVRLRDWLANVSRRRLAGGAALVATYQRFLAQKRPRWASGSIPRKSPMWISRRSRRAGWRPSGDRQAARQWPPPTASSPAAPPASGPPS